MKVIVFKTAKDKARGLLRYKTVPDNVAFVFPRVNQSGVVHSHGMSEAIKVYLLDHNLMGIGYRMLEPGQEASLAGATHMVETSKRSKNLGSNFDWLRKHIYGG